ncbi:MAG: outer membrane protein assembly factor BamD, partial [Syntrophorhabdaceae bacterium]|nr:outer membrane protein assembly factor BamD [Syntrophorhabdaceae bacterium]
LMKLKGAREAEAAFDDFLRLYPAHPKVPDALFLKSELLRRQILLPGRAQEKTRESITTYKRFLEKEQDTPRAETAVSRIKELNNHLLLHEEAIISHLISTRKYDSAMLRAKRVLEEFPEAAQSDKFQSMLALAVKKQTKKDEAVDGAEQTPTIIDEQTPKNLDEQTPKNLDEKTPKNPDN